MGEFMKYLVSAAVLACGLAQPAFAQDAEETTNDKAGLRIEGRLIYETPTVSNVEEEGDVYKLGSAVAFGGEVGFDIAVGKSVVVGPYANYEFSSVENCDGADCVSETDSYTVGLQIGVKVGSNGMIYLKGGYASMGLEASDGSLSFKERGNGIGGAIGYERGFGEHLYGRVEFGYSDNGKIFGIDFQRRHAGIALGARF